MRTRFVAILAVSCLTAAASVLLPVPSTVQATGQPEMASAPSFLRELRASPLAANTFVGPAQTGPHIKAATTATFIVNYNGFTPQAEAAFQYAVEIWASRVVSSVPIVVNASFTTLAPGVLGAAGPTFLFRDFPDAPMTGTWYPVAIANSRVGFDLTVEADIDAQFSNSFTWYFGTDGNAPPGTYDMVSVVLHELGHGLGFLGSGTIGGGFGSWGFGTGFPTIWDRFVVNGSGQPFINTGLFPNPSVALAGQITSNNLFFSGANARAANGGVSPKTYAPTTFSGGSSYSHLDEHAYPPGTPNSLMTPQLRSAEAIHDPGPIALGMFVDMGMNTALTCSYALSAPSASLTAAGGGGAVTVTTGAACSWTVQTFVPWVTISSPISGTGSDTVSFTVAPNTSSAARSATLIIAGQPFVITQAGVVCSLAVNPAADFVDATGGTRTIHVTANASDCVWSVSDTGDWLSTAISGGVGTMSFSYTAAANTTTSQRVGVISVNGIAVTIAQRPAGPKPFLDLDGNGAGDALLYNLTNGQFSMRAGTPGAFSTLTAGTWAAGWTVKKARFNSDALDDLFFYNPTSGFWYKALNVGSGGFSFYGYPWAANWTPVVGDWNGDGLSDVFIYNQVSGNWFRAITNPEALDFIYTSGTWAPGWSLYTGDFDGSGTDDIFIYNRNGMADVNSGKWFRVMMLDDGNFSYVAGDLRWANDWLPVAGDWNGDGNDDLFIYRSNGQWFKVFFLPMSATYVPGTWAGSWQIRVARFNDDNLEDLHLYNPTNGSSFAVLNDPTGNFIYYFTQWAPSWTVNLSDFTADGISDVLLYNATDGTGFQANTIAPGTWSYAAFSGWPTGMTVIAN